MASSIGKNIKVSIFGESHSDACGVSIEGVPAGIEIDFDNIEKLVERRRPKKDGLSTARSETDNPTFICGIKDGITTGTPITAIIQNSDTRSKDYDKLRNVPRPGHADFPAHIKYSGNNDIRGGGHFSARLTAPLVVAGAIFKQLLEQKGIFIGTHVSSIGDIIDDPIDPLTGSPTQLKDILKKQIPVFSDQKREKMIEKILLAKQNGDSVGGTVECSVVGLPVGVGSPMFDGIENRLSYGMFGIPAVKGIEFGSGFFGSSLLGSQNNDQYEMKDNAIKTKTNNSGGILGGLSNGMPIVFKVAFKPTPSIAKPQQTVNLSDLKNETLTIEGRHDPCVVIRGAAVVEAMASIVVYDMLQDV